MQTIIWKDITEEYNKKFSINYKKVERIDTKNIYMTIFYYRNNDVFATGFCFTNNNEINIYPEDGDVKVLAEEWIEEQLEKGN